MAVLSITEFETDTEFERLVLGRSVSILETTSVGGAIFDMTRGAAAGGTITVSLSDTLGGNGREETLAELLPLLFGAAWKVLDLLIELALANESLAPDLGGGRWSIKKKKEYASPATRRGLIAALPTHGRDALWDIYAATVETRHSLVHRRAHFDPATGSLRGHDPNTGLPLAPLSQLQQWALCRALRAV